MHAEYPTVYKDALGSEHTVLVIDGYTLSIVVRGTTWTGYDIDRLEPLPAPGYQPGTGPAYGGAFTTGWTLRYRQPLPVTVEQEERIAEVHITISPSRYAGYVAEMQLWVQGKSYTAGRNDVEGALADLQRQLPPGTAIRSCLFCAFSADSPVGRRSLFVDLFCFRDNRAAILAAKTKGDLLALLARPGSVTELVLETYICPEYERRGAGGH